MHISRLHEYSACLLVTCLACFLGFGSWKFEETETTFNLFYLTVGEWKLIYKLYYVEWMPSQRFRKCLMEAFVMIA